jgi:hypothetical protein
MIRRGAKHHDRRKGPLGVVAHALVHELIGDGRPKRRDQQRVAIGRSLCRCPRADIAVGARTILHDELLAQRIGESGRHRARENVGADAGREWQDHRHRTRGPGIGGERRCRRDKACCRDPNGSALDQAGLHLQWRTTAVPPRYCRLCNGIATRPMSHQYRSGGPDWTGRNDAGLTFRWLRPGI